jgi:hypothetical protein
VNIGFFGAGVLGRTGAESRRGDPGSAGVCAGVWGPAAMGRGSGHGLGMV